MNLGDNKFVHKGDLLIKIDPRDYQAQLDQAQRPTWPGAGATQCGAGATGHCPRAVSGAADAGEGAGAKRASESDADPAAYERQHAVDVRATSQQNIDTADAQQKSALANVAQAQAQVKTASLVPQQISQAQATVEERRQQVRTRPRRRSKRPQLNLVLHRIARACRRLGHQAQRAIRHVPAGGHVDLFAGDDARSGSRPTSRSRSLSACVPATRWMYQSMPIRT